MGVGLIFFHASLTNIFNKCHKKAIFMKNKPEFGYIIYELEVGDEIFYMLRGGSDLFTHE